MGKDEKEFIEALSNLAKSLKDLKQEIEMEIGNDSTENTVEEKTTKERTFTVSEIEEIIEQASEKTETDLEEMTESESIPTLLLRRQTIAVMGLFKSNIVERIDGDE